MEKIKGEIQAVRKDGKALQIENNWFQFFKPRTDFNKGEIVEIEYVINKNFNNIRKITKVEIKEPFWSKDINSNYEEPKLVKPVSDTSLNCILMQSVQYAKDKNIDLDKATIRLINSYKKIKESI